ncbi:hypothetical protein ZWY2020_018825 [Hordeum vulgare]|nr:hypothetical protein ZWY2020_018825 [Hordeum vulgare]
MTIDTIPLQRLASFNCTQRVLLLRILCILPRTEERYVQELLTRWTLLWTSGSSQDLVLCSHPAATSYTAIPPAAPRLNAAHR